MKKYIIIALLSLSCFQVSADAVSNVYAAMRGNTRTWGDPYIKSKYSSVRPEQLEASIRRVYQIPEYVKHISVLMEILKAKYYEEKITTDMWNRLIVEEQTFRQKYERLKEQKTYDKEYTKLYNDLYYLNIIYREAVREAKSTIIAHGSDF